MSENTVGFAQRPATLDAPYYAVIFTSRLRPAEAEAATRYAEAAEHMLTLAAQQPGYLGAESAARDGSGLGITVSYWRSLEDIAAWRRHAEHAATRERGRSEWYAHYELRVARVERSYGWDQASAEGHEKTAGSAHP